MAVLSVTLTLSATLDVDERDHGAASARDVLDLYRGELSRYSLPMLTRLIEQNGGTRVALDVELTDETPYVGLGGGE